MGNDWFHEYFINELKAIGRKPTSNMQHEVVDSLPSSGNEQTIYFVKNDSSSSNNHYDEYVWISSSSTFEKIGSSQIDGSAANPDWNQNDATQPDYVKNRPFYTGDPVETVLVEETTVAFEDIGEGIYLAAPQLAFDAIVGVTYKVTWDGTIYESICTEFEKILLIGNLFFSGVGSDTGEPFLVVIEDGILIQIVTTDTSASHTISISETFQQIVKIDKKYLPLQFKPVFKPEGKSYLTFSSPNEFTLSLRYGQIGWNGTLEYFASDETWTTWSGRNVLSAVANGGEYVLYLRGIGNSGIGGKECEWNLDGTDIKCIGNIENLLDYATVESGNHPIMSNNCYQYMFNDCTSLIQAPALPATTLTSYCYTCMFGCCTSLTQAPALPATTLASNCYASMFSGCTSLTQAPALPATTLADHCYLNMFNGCTSLTHAPILPATTLADDCYQNMFGGCTSLIQAPALPATTLTSNCYVSMFSGCTSLTQAPAFPATTLADHCYQYMFNDCTSLIQAPALPATTLTSYCYTCMFGGCTSLTQAPALPATTLVDYCYNEMFRGCTSLTKIPILPATTLAESCYESMFNGCSSLKLSPTQTDEYTQEYRIPSSGNGTIAINALRNMFGSTGGTFTGTPEINTAYYLSSENMIARETEIATLNGYVGSMINNALSKINVAEEGAY